MGRIPVGDAVEAGLQWLTDNAGGFFDVVSSALLFMVNTVYTVLSAPPSAVLIAIFAVLMIAATRSIGLTLFTVLAFALVVSMDLWPQTLETLAVVIIAAAASVLVGVPVGILAASSARVSFVARPVLDFMQTLPVFVYLVPSVFLFGIGVVPGIAATTVFAIPPAVRLTELGIRQVDGEVLEASRAFGSRPAQVLREVQLPLALPSIMAGVNQVIMLALSMVVVAGLVGAQGLGGVVVNGVTQFNIGTAFEGGIAVVVLAIFLDRVTGVVGRSGSARRRPVAALLALVRPKGRRKEPEAEPAPA